MDTSGSRKHMRIVLIVFGAFVAINIVGLARFFGTKAPGNISPLFSYVQADIQQAVLLRSDKVLDLLGDEVATATSNPIYQVLLDSKNLGLLQFAASSGDVRSAIIVDATKTFQPNQFLSVINMQDDTDYSYDTYDDDIYVFATPDTIELLMQRQNNLLIHAENFEKIRPLVAGQDVVVVSRVDPDAAPIPDENIAQFVSRSEAFVIGLKLQKNGLNLDAHLLYKQTLTGLDTYTFQPSMTDNISDQTMIYIETNPTGLFTETNKNDILSGFRTYDPITLSGMSDDDLWHIITSNIALIAQNSVTFDDLRLALLLGTQKAYPLIEQIFPLLQEPLAGLIGIDQSLLPAVQEQDRIAYNTTLFGLVPLSLQSYKTDNQTVISLGSASKITQNGSHDKLPVPEGSIAYIYVQFDPILQLYKQFGTMVGQNVQDPFFIQQQKLLQGKTRAGYIQSTPDMLSLHSVIQ